MKVTGGIINQLKALFDKDDSISTQSNLEIPTKDESKQRVSKLNTNMGIEFSRSLSLPDIPSSYHEKYSYSQPIKCLKYIPKIGNNNGLLESILEGKNTFMTSGIISSKKKQLKELQNLLQSRMSSKYKLIRSNKIIKLRSSSKVEKLNVVPQTRKPSVYKNEASEKENSITDIRIKKVPWRNNDYKRLPLPALKMNRGIRNEPVFQSMSLEMIKVYKNAQINNRLLNRLGILLKGKIKRYFWPRIMSRSRRCGFDEIMNSDEMNVELVNYEENKKRRFNPLPYSIGK